MRHLLASLMALVALALFVGAPTRAAAQSVLTNTTDVLLQTVDGAEADLQGVALGEAYGKFLLLRDSVDMVVVRLKPEHQALNIQRGDLVAVNGKVLRTGTIRNNVEATEVKIILRAKNPLQPLLAPTVAQALTKNDGEVVSVVGEIKRTRDNYVILGDGTGEIVVDLGERYSERRIQIGAQAAAVGLMDTAVTVKRVMRVVAFAQLDMLGEAPKNAPKEKIGDVLSGNKAGEQVAVRGRVVKYVGKQNLDIVFDGQNFLILHPTGASKDIQLRAGQAIEATGTFQVETIDGKEYGTLTNAQVKKLSD